MIKDIKTYSTSPGAVFAAIGGRGDADVAEAARADVAEWAAKHLREQGHLPGGVIGETGQPCPLPSVDQALGSAIVSRRTGGAVLSGTTAEVAAMINATAPWWGGVRVGSDPDKDQAMGKLAAGFHKDPTQRLEPWQM